MSMEIAISPAGRLHAEAAPDLTPRVDERLGRRVVEAFKAGNADGLLFLATGLIGMPLPPSLAYWREFAQKYIQRLCHQPIEPCAPAPLLPVGPAEAAELVLRAPPMRGGTEFLSSGLLTRLWTELGSLIEQQTADGGFGAWLRTHGPSGTPWAG